MKRIEGYEYCNGCNTYIEKEGYIYSEDLCCSCVDDLELEDEQYMEDREE